MVYIYQNQNTYPAFCKSKGGSYSGDYVVKNYCLIPENEVYIKYSIDYDNSKLILVKE